MPIFFMLITKYKQMVIGYSMAISADISADLVQFVGITDKLPYAVYFFRYKGTPSTQIREKINRWRKIRHHPAPQS
jgi:hypothetical protein